MDTLEDLQLQLAARRFLARQARKRGDAVLLRLDVQAIREIRRQIWEESDSLRWMAKIEVDSDVGSLTATDAPTNPGTDIGFHVGFDLGRKPAPYLQTEKETYPPNGKKRKERERKEKEGCVNAGAPADAGTGDPERHRHAARQVEQHARFQDSLGTPESRAKAAGLRHAVHVFRILGRLDLPTVAALRAAPLDAGDILLPGLDPAA